MTKHQINLRKIIFKYMEEHPETSNKDIKIIFAQHPVNSVTTYRTQWNKENKAKLPNNKKSSIEEKLKELTEDILFEKINEETIEETLLAAVNVGDISTNLIKCMIDFFVKIKGKRDEMEDDIDMEVLKEIGIVIKSGD